MNYKTGNCLKYEKVDKRKADSGLCCQLKVDDLLSNNFFSLGCRLFFL